MPNRHRYDVGAAWDDPTEHRVDQRRAPRFDLRYRLHIAVENREKRRRLVGPGITTNLSAAGAYLKTKHTLEPNQGMTVSFSTRMCPDTLGLPRTFVGNARVRRVARTDDRVREVAVEWGDSLTQNIEFGIFLDHLRDIAAKVAV